MLSARQALRTTRRSLGYDPPGRSVTVRFDDVFLVSYPRSGNVWLRFILGNLTDTATPVDFLNIEHRVPDIYASSTRSLLRLPSPRLLKSHEYFDPRYERVVCVTRDPRAILPSYYRWQLNFGHISSRCPGRDYLERFLLGDLDPFGSWLANVGSWFGARAGDPSFLHLRYEDLLVKPVDIAQRLARFLGLCRSAEDIKSAIQKSDRTTMQAVERKQRSTSALIRGYRSDIPLVGAEGNVSVVDATDAFLRSPTARDAVHKRFRRLMEELDYT